MTGAVPPAPKKFAKRAPDMVEYFPSYESVYPILIDSLYPFPKNTRRRGVCPPAPVGWCSSRRRLAPPARLRGPLRLKAARL
jgi:hypothetical protein